MKPTITPNPKQALAWQAWFDNTTRYIVFGGAAYGGKTWWLCEVMLVQAYTHPGSKSFIAREELKRLMSSTYVTWTKVCAYHKIPSTDWRLNGQYNYIEFKNGSRIDLLDVKAVPSDPEFERFGSLEFTNGGIDEAGEIAFKAFDVLKSRVGRHRNTEWGLLPKIILTCNPSHNFLYLMAYKPWKAGKLPLDWKYIQAFYTDNSFGATEYGEQLATIQDESVRLRLKEGVWEYNADPRILMDINARTDVFSNTVEESTEKYLTADLARFGGDEIVIFLWRGLYAYKCVHFNRRGLDETKTVIRTLAAEEQIPWSHVLVDEDGVGGGLVDSMPGIKGFQGGSSPIIRGADVYGLKKPDNFQNLRTQCYFELANSINQHSMSVHITDPDIRDRIITELGAIKRLDLDGEGKLKIIPKDEIKQMLGHSPDFADSLMMRMWFELRASVKDREVENPPSSIDKELAEHRRGLRRPLHARF